MNIEKILLASGRSSFDRIHKFIKTLYIKNDAEAKLTETLESIKTYEDYKYAFEKSDSFKDYTYSYNLLKIYGFTESEQNLYIDADQLDKALYKRDARAISMITYLRKKRISEYIEHNPYYKVFLGIPKDSSENILVKNTDKTLSNEPDTIYLHEVSLSKYPKTYNRLFVKNGFKIILESFNYEYLQFIKSPLNIYKIHETQHYSIIKYSNDILEPSELKYFFQTYNQVKNQILEIDFIQGFQDSYFEYSLIMLSFILYGTFIQFYNKMIERYSMRMYTEDEIYDILDSNGLSSLKKLNLSLLRKVVDKIPDLKATRGTNKVIDIIFDIIADKSLAIKRYYLIKKYNIDSQGLLSINDDSIYEKSVDLTFIEKTVKAGTDVISTTDTVIDYHDFILDDDTWGGVVGIDEEQTKYNIRENLRKRILKLDFSSLITKYISVSKIINMYNKILVLTNLLGLLYQINEERDNFMSNVDIINYKGIQTTPISIFSAWCWAYSKYNGITNPTYIVTRASTIYDIMRLRHVDGVVDDTDELGNFNVSLGNGFTRKLKEFISSEKIQSLLVKFNYTSETSITDILSQYELNAAIIEEIRNKMINTNSLEEYNAWKILYDANIISFRSMNLFEGYEYYNEYLNNLSPLFYNYVEPIINGNDKAILLSLIKSLGETFATYISEKTKNMTSYYTDENQIIGGENINDIIILLNSFMSMFTQIYKTDFYVGYDNQLKNSLRFLYASVALTSINSEQEFAFLKYKLYNDMHYYFKDNAVSLQLLHQINEQLFDDNEFTIRLFYEVMSAISYDDYTQPLSFIYDLFIDSIFGNVVDSISTLQYVAKEIS